MLDSHARQIQTKDNGPSAKDVLAYLHELLQQSAFSASERNRRFLSYVVEETLQGRADRIKAYNIALAAFDRTAEFDPLTDPIVRIEASRLRRSLEHYYLTAGCADRIRIAIPKGSYAATFSYQCDAATDVDAAPTVVSSDRRPTQGRRVRWLGLQWANLAVAAFCVMVAAAAGASFGLLNRAGDTAPSSAAGQASLLILPFEDTGGDPSRAYLARGITYDVSTALMDLENVAIYGQGPGFGGRPLIGVASDFTLVGSVQSDQESIRVAVFLMDSKTGRFLQSWSFQRGMAANSLAGTQMMRIAQDIRRSLERDCMPISGADIVGSAPRALLDCRRLVALSKN
jgi:adenylate cyclase